MDLQFTPDIQTLARITMDDKPPPGNHHWPGIPWKCVCYGDNRIHAQRITGEFFRALRIYVRLATPARLVPVVRQPTVAIAFQHRGFAWGRLSGVRGTLQFRAGHYYTPLLLPGSNQESLIELEAGHYEATVILIEKKYEAAFLKLFPSLGAEVERILSRNSSGLPYPPQPLTPAISKLLHPITRYKGPPDSLNFTISLAVSGLILALYQHQQERLATSNNAYLIHAYLIGRLAEPLTAGRVATALHMTRKKLHGLMKQYFRKTFKEYLTQLRMETARELLSGSDRKLDDIALELGYRSMAHFSNAFLKNEGQRPSEYRKTKR